jgi:hypothetical protein
MTDKELIRLAIDYIQTEAGRKALKIGLDANQLKNVVSAAKNPEEKDVIVDKLKGFIPKLEIFEIEGKIYDKTTSKPIQGVKVEPLLAKIHPEGKKIFTDDKGEYKIKVKIPYLPFNNKSLLQSQLIFSHKEYIPGTGELVTQKREIKTDLKSKPLINIKLAAEQAAMDLKKEVYSKIEGASKIASSLPEKILLIRRKQVEKFTNTLLFKLLPLAVSLLLVFGITKIKDRGKKICPTKEQLKRAAKKRNKIAKQLNQIYIMVAINIGLAILFNYLAIQLRGMRGQITSLSFPVATPPGIGVPQSLLSILQNFKDILENLSNENKKLNIQLIIALIFFIIAMIILSMIIKTVDSLIFECANDEDIDLVELNPSIQELASEEDISEEKNKIAGFTIEVVQLDKNSVGNLKRRQAIGKNDQGIVLVKGDPSFSASDNVLIEELIFYIRANDLKAN